MDRDPTSDDLIREAKQWAAPDPSPQSAPPSPASVTTPVYDRAASAPLYPSDLIDRPTTPDPSPIAAPAPPRPGREGRVWFSIIVALIGVVIAGVVVYRQVTSSDTGQIFSLAPGTCFLEPDRARVGEVETVDCASVHDLEVFATVTLPFAPGEPLPDDETLWGTAWEQCLPFFEPYTGEPYDQSSWWLDAFVPDRHSWKAGDREAVCVLYLGDVEGNQLPATTSASTGMST
jgi:hypothetical protein